MKKLCFIYVLFGAAICFDRADAGSIKGFNFENPSFCKALVCNISENPRVDEARDKIEFLLLHQLNLDSDQRQALDRLSTNPFFIVYVYYGFITEPKIQELADAAKRELVASLKMPTDEAVLNVISKQLEDLLTGDFKLQKAARKGAAAIASEYPFQRSKWGHLLHQLRNFPATVARIHKLVRENYNFAAFDENMYAFWGFHNLPMVNHYLMRTWPPVKINLIGPWMVQNLSPLEHAQIMNVAMEIEDPIAGYSAESGRGFRFLLPNLGRFMGKNPEQAAYAKANDIAWCESPWCREEDRHGNAFARMIKYLVGIDPARDNPTDVSTVTEDEHSAVQHMYSRESTEWNASSTYVVLAAHAKPGTELEAFLFNLMRDEIKHLTVVGGADVYLHGNRPWRRTYELVKKALEMFFYHKDERSEGSAFTANYVTLTEIIISHVLTEYYTRKWLRTLPIHLLARIYDSESKLPELAAFKLPPEQQAVVDRELAEGKAKRENFARWTEKMRMEVQERLAYLKRHAGEIEAVVQVVFDGFNGAEVYGSQRHLEIERAINSIDAAEHIKGEDSIDDWMFRRTLRDQLRAYQIKNNRFVSSGGEEAGIRHGEEKARQRAELKEAKQAKAVE